MTHPSPSSGRSLTLSEAMLPVVVMFVLFAVGSWTLGPTGELLILVLLGAAAVAGAIAVRHGSSWDDIQRSTGDKLASVLPALLILLSIGVLIATWVLSGTIPTLVSWGVRVVDPRYLLVTAFLATALMSLCTGTSWGSAGTVGVALMGTALALEAPLAATAGAVVSGAYFGDKLSPLSDSTNITAIGAGADLYAHIRHMLWTAVPSFVVGLGVYLVASRASVPTGAPESARVLLTELDEAFRLGWLTLLPVVVVIVGIARRTPPALAIAGASAVALLLAILWQGVLVGDAVVATVGGVRAEMLLDGGQGTSDTFQTLVQRGGLYSMANTLIVVISAFLLAGAMDASGALDLLVRRLLGAVRSVFGLIAATMAAGATTIALTSHGGVTALILGELFQGAYDARDLERVNLSRSLEDSVTLTEPLMPWTVSAVFMASTLGVSTVAYAPWAIFCWMGPLMSLFWAGLFKVWPGGLRVVAETSPAGGR